MRNQKALRALGIFFLTMAILTGIARAADTLTLANVRTEKLKAGALSHEAKVEGEVEAARETLVWTQPNLRVESVLVRESARVEAGAPLFRVERGALRAAIEKARTECEKLAGECVESAALAGEANLLSKQRALDDAQREYDETKRSKEKKVAKRKLGRAKEDYDLAVRENENKIAQEKTAIAARKKELAQKEAEWKALAALLEADCEVRATAAGLVSKLTVEAGKQTGEEAVARIASLEDGLLLTCKVTKEQVKHIVPGDLALVKNANGKGDERVSVLGVSQEDKEGLYKVTVELPSTEYSIGAKVEVKFSKKTERFPQCVKNSALRSDSTGSFVLVMRTKQSVLGEGAVAERVAVFVLDQDGERAGIEGALLETDLVITESDKTLVPGDRVRPLAS